MEVIEATVNNFTSDELYSASHDSGPDDSSDDEEAPIVELKKPLPPQSMIINALDE